jgi:hypothetical protein
MDGPIGLFLMDYLSCNGNFFLSSTYLIWILSKNNKAIYFLMNQVIMSILGSCFIQCNLIKTSIRVTILSSVLTIV